MATPTWANIASCGNQKPPTSPHPSLLTGTHESHVRISAAKVMDILDPKNFEDQGQDEEYQDTEDGEQIFAKSSLYRADEFWNAYKIFLNDDTWLDSVPWGSGDFMSKPYILLTHLLDVYQGEPYLLDPYLESIIEPIISKFRSNLSTILERTETIEEDKRSDVLIEYLRTDRMEQLSLFIYWICKVRGEKYIVHYFPHAVADLSLLLRTFALLPTAKSVSWQMNFVLLLWMSLVITLPFSLSNFDSILASLGGGNTVERIETIALTYLHQSSKDRDACVRLLSSLYSRADGALGSRLHHFMEEMKVEIQFISEKAKKWNVEDAAILQALSASLKAIPRQTVVPLLNEIYEFVLLFEGEDKRGKGRSILARKYWTKCLGRVALLYLPFRHESTRKLKTAFTENDLADTSIDIEDDDENFAMPEEVEETVQYMLVGLEDKDTLVRYSSAKYLARIGDRLPRSLSYQLLDAVLSLFTDISFDDSGEVDNFTVKENTWHGACLAIAEMVRRGRIGEVEDVLTWITRALKFDYLRGSQPVGSSVRDSACYVLWALSRSGIFLTDVQIQLMANTLVQVACFDKEVHVRRAASAAFQEAAGRLGRVPHGIDIVQKMDGLAVGLRRTCFLKTAPALAIFEQYRSPLIEQVLTKTITHYDAEMRELGGKSLALILKLENIEEVKVVAEKLIARLSEKEDKVVHGALWTLAELANVCRENGTTEYINVCVDIFKSLSNISPSLLNAYSAAPILIASCAVIHNAYSPEGVVEEQEQKWWRIITICLRNGDDACHLAAAEALNNISKFHDCVTLLEEIKRSLAVPQQGAALILGRIDYTGPCNVYYKKVLSVLIPFIDTQSTHKATSIEGRRNGFEALNRITTSLIADPGFSTEGLGAKVIPLFIEGLQDYTSDRRGDVGSWVRATCLDGLGALVSLMVKNEALAIAQLPTDTVNLVVASILKQTLEKIDSLRITGRNALLSILRAADSRTTIKIYHRELFQPILEQDETEWRNIGKVFEFLLPILAVPEYRSVYLEGVVLGLGTRTESSMGPAATAFVDYASMLDVLAEDEKAYSLLSLCTDLFQLAKAKYSQNRIFIPAAQTVGLLLEAEILESLTESEAGSAILHKILDIFIKASNSKIVQRMIVCAKNIVLCYNIEILRPRVLAALSNFLTHSIPRVRSAVADDLYLVLQTRDEVTDPIQTTLLDTAWLTASDRELKLKSGELISLLSEL